MRASTIDAFTRLKASTLNENRRLSNRNVLSQCVELLERGIVRRSLRLDADVDGAERPGPVRRLNRAVELQTFTHIVEARRRHPPTAARTSRMPWPASVDRSGRSNRGRSEDRSWSDR